jgi:hypothetical protein
MEHISYIKNTKWKKAFERVSILFFAALFLMPGYFGFEIGSFDVTMQRLTMIILCLFIFEKRQRTGEFMDIIRKSDYTFILIMYLFVLFYTTVIRKNVNSFLGPFIEILCLYLMMYIFRYSLGVIRTIKIIDIFSYLLTIQGVIEFQLKRSLFSYLVNLPGIYTGANTRSGTYRIMGPCNHSLAYGLVLLIIIPITCYNEKEREINVFGKPLLQLLLFINVILNGSRSTLGLYFLEFILLFLASSKKNRKRNTFYLLFFILFFACLIGITFKAPMSQYVLRSFAAVIDTVFNTQFAARFGADMTVLKNSEEYRKGLVQIFKLKYLNPLVGRGVFTNFRARINGYTVQSVDNFYICQYIKYAYPGMISFVIFIIYGMLKAIRETIANRNSFCFVLFISLLAYYINLWYMDQLMTIKYSYMVFALIYAAACETVNQRKAADA